MPKQFGGKILPLTQALSLVLCFWKSKHVSLACWHIATYRFGYNGEEKLLKTVDMFQTDKKQESPIFPWPSLLNKMEYKLSQSYLCACTPKYLFHVQSSEALSLNY